jgi:RNA polymerase sigma-70 factor (ECF subfamily)
MVELLLQGSSSAWESLIDRYAPLVRHRIECICMSCGRRPDPSLLDDIAADVFSALIRNEGAALRAFQGRSSLGTYLCVIASRIALRQVVHPSKAACHTSDAQGERVTNHSPGFELEHVVDHRQPPPHVAAITAEEKEHLSERIGQLPPRQREMIRLYYLSGQSYQQISQQLQVPIGSVGPTIKRAEERLRLSWAKQNPSAESDA